MLSRKYDKERVAGKRKAGKVFHKDTTKPNTEDKGAGRVRVAGWEDSPVVVGVENGTDDDVIRAYGVWGRNDTILTIHLCEEKSIV